jgi:hypothetical protein
MAELNVLAFGVSPIFPITAEEFKLWQSQAVTRVDIDGVEPPTLGEGGGHSAAHSLKNKWFPWIDEKLVTPKYDGVSQFLGTPSNRPTHIRDYHMISLMRAVDYILDPQYVGNLEARVDSVLPVSPPIPENQ